MIFRGVSPHTGVYSLLVIFSTRMLLKRGLRTQANHVMFIMTLFTYLLSTAYWAYSFAKVVHEMIIFIDDPQNPVNSTSGRHDAFTKGAQVFNAVLPVNYIFSDAVVVWRAWIICWRNYRKYLCITIVFLVLTALSVTGTIVFRVIAFVLAPYAQNPPTEFLLEGTNILQMCVLAFSLISNVSATAVVGATAWRHRQLIRAAFANKKTRADQILALVVESGILYCFSGLTVLIASLIRLPQGTLGDIYTPINLQIAARVFELFHLVA
ncbi:hypothetical protein K438DRAFT_665349 [Mycena galopus ATCC 62051]|nr:hypothetical protein K438DRAFT_665349 [Mycena galopus ATCC 62051]